MIRSLALLSLFFLFEASAADAQFDGAMGFSDFSSLDAVEGQKIIDADRTTEGQQRMKELKGKAKSLCGRIERLREQRRPHDAKRATLIGPYQQAQARVANANRAGLAAQNAIPNLQRRLQLAFAERDKRALRTQISNANQTIANAKNAIAAANSVISNLGPQIEAINIVIKPINDQIIDAFRQLDECRQQWAAICRPDVKYAREDYEILRGLLDSWLLADGLWPDGMLWAGMCAYATADFKVAAAYLNKIEVLNERVFLQKNLGPKFLTLKAMIVRDQPDTDSRKSSRDARRWTTSVASTLRTMERSSKVKPDPLAYFILAEFHASRTPEHRRAAQNYNLALKHDPNNMCALAGLGRLQIQSESDDIASPEKGTEALQELWDRCETKSWRLAMDLADGYRKCDQPNKSREMIEYVLADRTVPQETKDEIRGRLN